MVSFLKADVFNLFSKGPQPLLWAGLGAARVKITVSKNTKVKVKFTLEEALKAQRGNRGVTLLFL